MQYDLSELMQLAQSPAGQQLLSLLQRTGGNTLQEAVNQASAGNFDQAKQVLSSLLASGEAQVLLKKLEENP